MIFCIYDTILAYTILYHHYFLLLFLKIFILKVIVLINFVFGISGLIGLKRLLNFSLVKKFQFIFLITLFSQFFLDIYLSILKDTIIATVNFWIIYYLIRYLNTDSYQIRKTLQLRLVFLGLGIGVRVLFLGTLILFFVFLYGSFL